MDNLDAKVQAARDAGWSDDQINQYLANRQSSSGSNTAATTTIDSGGDPRIQQAREAGWSDEQINEYLQSSDNKLSSEISPPMPAGPVKDNLRTLGKYQAISPYADPKTNPYSDEYVGNAAKNAFTAGMWAGGGIKPAVDVLTHPVALAGAGGALAASYGPKLLDAIRSAPAGPKMTPLYPQASLASRALPIAGAAGLLAAPLMMAQSRRQEIDANPNAPGLENNPYAMSVRSQPTDKYVTPYQAGAANRRAAIRAQAEQIQNSGETYPATEGIKDMAKMGASVADTLFGGIQGLTALATSVAMRSNIARGAEELSNKITGNNTNYTGQENVREVIKTMSPEWATNPVGTLAGITKDPAYRLEPTRQLTEALGHGIQTGAEKIENLTGIPSIDVENAANLGLLAAGARGSKGMIGEKPATPIVGERPVAPVTTTKTTTPMSSVAQQPEMVGPPAPVMPRETAPATAVTETSVAPKNNIATHLQNITEQNPGLKSELVEANAIKVRAAELAQEQKAQGRVVLDKAANTQLARRELMDYRAEMAARRRAEYEASPEFKQKQEAEAARIAEQTRINDEQAVARARAKEEADIIAQQVRDRTAQNQPQPITSVEPTVSTTPTTPTVTTSPVVPTNKLSDLKNQVIEEAKTATPIADTAAEMAERVKAQKQYETQISQDLIQQAVTGQADIPFGSGIWHPIDTAAHTGPVNKLAKALEKAGIEQIPDIPGMTAEQVIRAVHGEWSGKPVKTTEPKLEPKTETTPKKESFDIDGKKYHERVSKKEANELIKKYEQEGTPYSLSYRDKGVETYIDIKPIKPVKGSWLDKGDFKGNKVVKTMVLDWPAKNIKGSFTEKYYGTENGQKVMYQWSSDYNRANDTVTKYRVFNDGKLSEPLAIFDIKGNKIK